MRPVLDSNILFSAALGGESFELVWDLARAGKVKLFTSRYCAQEATDNLARRRPGALERGRELLEALVELRDADPAAALPP